MLQNRVSLGAQLFRRHRNAHFDVFDFPLGPRAAIHPDTAVFQPLRASLLLFVDGGENGVGTFAVSSVRVGQVASHINLMRLHFVDEFLNNDDILLRHRQFLDFSALVERQVEEMDAAERNFVVDAGRASLSATNQTLDVQDVARVEVAFFFLREEFLDFSIFFVENIVFSFAENLMETLDKQQEARNFLVADGNVSTRFVSHVNFVTLRDESLNRSTHRNHVVVGVRREHDNALRERRCSLRTMGVVGIRLTAWPARNRML